MKTLTLFRHAKSGLKDSPTIADIDRPLNERGRKAAAAMGTAMRDRGIKPGLVLCSPSLRTKQTLALAADAAWDVPPQIQFEDRLYHASAATMLDIVRHVANSVSHAMIVGHNPGLQDLAAELAAQGGRGDEMPGGKFPTGGLAQFGFEIETWGNMAAPSGHLDLFLTPRSLNTQ